MLVPSFPLLSAVLSLQISFSKASPVRERHIAPVRQPPATQPPYPTIYSPVVLNQLCQEPDNYCIVVDQISPGSVKATATNATDAQGAFLFQRSSYMTSPFYVCYGSCCIALDFSKTPGCVTMNYVYRDSGGQPGHLIARFADDIYNFVGPRNMLKSFEACPDPKGFLPYAVIGARSGNDSPKHQKKQRSKKNYSRGDDAFILASAGASSNPSADDNRPVRDHVDDVTVPLADA